LPTLLKIKVGKLVVQMVYNFTTMVLADLVLIGGNLDAGICKFISVVHNVTINGASQANLVLVG
jgi:hypothetical protein